MGDLEELWRARRATRGRLRASAWYAWQAATVMWSYRIERGDDEGGEPMWDAAAVMRTTARRLARAPIYSLSVIGTLALGVGANAAVYSLVAGVLSEPLSYPEADRIAFVYEQSDGTDVPPGWSAAPNYLDWRERARSFQSLALFRGRSVSVTTDVVPTYAYGALVTSDFFDVFGVEPALGRRFDRDEVEGGEPVVVLGYGLWERGFGADEDIVGRTIRVDGEPHTVVGVMPPGFEAHGDWVGRAVDLWRPMRITDDVLGQGRSFHVAGRLADGVTLSAARDEMSALQDALVLLRPDQNEGWMVRLVPYREMIVGDVSPALWLLLATTAIVLVIACTNVAGLAVNRVLDRRDELATRLALGAGRGSVVGLVLAESIVLSAAGGALGLAVARGFLGLIRATEPGRIPRLELVRIDGGVLLFSLLIVSLTALAFGGAATASALRTAPGGVLRAPRSGGRRGLGRHALVMLQLALSFALVLTAGLLERSFVGLRTTDLGFDPEGVQAATVTLSWDRVSSLEERTRFTTEVLAALRALPGAESVGMINSLPLSDSNAMQQVEIEGVTRAREGPTVPIRGISPGYLETLDIPVLSGRAFEERDVDEPYGVLVNRTMAARYWPDGGAVGRRLRGEGDERWSTVLGVVGDVRHYGPAEAARPEVYVPYSTEYLTSKTFVVRSPAADAALGARIREAIAGVDPDQPVREVRSMEEWARGATAGARFRAWTMMLAAALATALAAVGLYGVLAGLVRSRTPELAVRMALGAQRRRVLSLVLARAGRLIAAGVAGGTALALLFTGVLEEFLQGVSVHDPTVIGAAVLLFTVIGAAATLAPARRATSLDTARILREE